MIDSLVDRAKADLKVVAGLSGIGRRVEVELNNRVAGQDRLAKGELGGVEVRVHRGRHDGGCHQDPVLGLLADEMHRLQSVTRRRSSCCLIPQIHVPILQKWT